MFEYTVLRLIQKDDHFVDIRVPFGSMETICRWFINDHNDFVIQIVGRGLCDNDNCFEDKILFCNLDEKENKKEDENKDELP